MTILPSACARRLPANDNVVATGRPPPWRRREPPDNTGKVIRSGSLRTVVRVLPMAAFSAVVLLAVSGAFLIGLVFVGLVTAAVVGLTVIRRYLRSPLPVWRLDRGAIG